MRFPAISSSGSPQQQFYSIKSGILYIPINKHFDNPSSVETV